IELARREVPDLHVVAFGPPEEFAHLPLPAGAEYHGGVPDAALPGLYGKSDMWLFTSRREGFGLPILEAMACRTPVIATPAGAAPLVLSHGGGRLLPACEPQPMARAIIDIARMDEPQWRTLSDAARDTALRYPWSAAIDAFERGLHRAIQRAS